MTALNIGSKKGVHINNAMSMQPLRSDVEKSTALFTVENYRLNYDQTRLINEGT